MMRWTIIRHAVVASTMDEIAALATKGAPEGTVVVAEHQTAGRGRAGRPWVSTPATAVQCSILLRPQVAPDHLSPLSLVVGVAVAEALESFGMTPALKWPNDILLDGRKVAGILVTSRIGTNELAVVVGIGINTSGDLATLPEGATSILAETGNAPYPQALLTGVLDRLDAGYEMFISSGGHPDLSGWTRRAAMLGGQVEIRDGATTHRGVFVGIDGDGALVLRNDAGAIRRIVAGDLTRGPRVSPENG